MLEFRGLVRRPRCGHLSAEKLFANRISRHLATYGYLFAPRGSRPGRILCPLAALKFTSGWPTTRQPTQVCLLNPMVHKGYPSGLGKCGDCNMHEVFGKDRQCRFKSNSSEDETLLLETRTVHIFCEHLSRGDESARHQNLFYELTGNPRLAAR